MLVAPGRFAESELREGTYRLVRVILGDRGERGAAGASRARDPQHRGESGALGTGVDHGPERRDRIRAARADGLRDAGPNVGVGIVEQPDDVGNGVVVAGEQRTAGGEPHRRRLVAHEREHARSRDAAARDLDADATERGIGIAEEILRLREGESIGQDREGAIIPTSVQRAGRATMRPDELLRGFAIPIGASVA